MNFKKNLICFLIILTFTSFSGCLFPMEPTSSKNYTMLPVSNVSESDSFNESYAWWIFEEQMKIVYDYDYNADVSIDFIENTKNMKKAPNMPFYTLQADFLIGETDFMEMHTGKVLIVENYVPIRTESDDYCYYSAVTYVRDYDKWKKGSISKEPDISNYRNTAVSLQ